MIENLLEKYKQEKIKLTTPKGEVHEMSVYEMSRWFCLIEAIDIVDKKIKQTGMTEDDKFWVKPIPIQKYIDERSDSMLFDLVKTDALDKIREAC